jgi:C-terminal processing protease CtpA/Prc
LGLQLLSRYIATFDFPNDRLYLENGRRFDEPERFGWCGMALFRTGGTIRVKEILPDSPADAVALKVGDEILQIDEQAASSMSLFEIRSFSK